MDRIYIDFKNCHGIKNLRKDLEFKGGNVILLYAPNGTMKTSFTNTIKDLSEGKKPYNKVFKHEPKHTIRLGKNQLDTKEDIKENIYVVESIKRDFDFLGSAPLISNIKQREQYAEIFKDLNNLKEDFLKKVKSFSKLGGNKSDAILKIEKQIINDFNSSNLLDLLGKIDLDDNIYSNLSSFKYNDLFNDKVIKLLNDKKVKEDIEVYSDNLDYLINSSDIFDKNDFYYNNANALYRAIKNNNLFNAGHSINFKSLSKPITSLEELRDVFDNEIKRIFKDDSLADNFKEINKKFSNQETRNFQDILTNNPEIVPLLADIDKLKQDYWISIFKLLENDIKVLVEEFNSKRNILKTIEEDAKKERTTWNDVIDLFNSRFSVPFTLTIGNKEDVILNNNVPEIHFLYEQGGEKEEITLDELKEFCSMGQLRALYLLDVIYKIKVIEDVNHPKLLVMDDIADSFDYQNKYAIVEYLNDLDKSGAFKILLLTHNYDFFRTVDARILNCSHYFAIKDGGKITLDDKKIKKDILDHLKEGISNNNNPNQISIALRFFIAIIPFIRNLANYAGDNDNVDRLTSILHYKEDGMNLKIDDLADVCNIWNIKMPASDKFIYEIIEDAADEICEIRKTKMNIENKMVLSIAIRHQSEKYMFERLDITDKEISENQTRELVNMYQEEYPNNDEIAIFEKVKMMTPENIHVNSFMYEPILDMDDHHLIKLYKEVKKLNS